MDDKPPAGPQAGPKPSGLAKIPMGLKPKTRQNATAQPATVMPQGIASRPVPKAPEAPLPSEPMVAPRRSLFGAIQAPKVQGPKPPLPTEVPAEAARIAQVAGPKKTAPPPPAPEPDSDSESNSNSSTNSSSNTSNSEEEEKPVARVAVPPPAPAPTGPRKKSDCIGPDGEPKPIDPEYKPYSVALKKSTGKDTFEKYKIKEPVGPFKVSNRFSFSHFIPTKFTDFKITSVPPADPEACKKMTFQENKYQQFIREYFRLDSPTRGALVYHGLGSGKTCSAIAAAESLFSESGRKIIIMTPVSLRANFIREIKFCGFKIYRTENHWQSLDLLGDDGKIDWSVYCFAKSVLRVSHAYMQKVIEAEKTKKLIWVPDMRTGKAPNYAALSKASQRQITQQIDDMIQNSITFLGYNGLSEKKLKQIAINEPTFFDNAIIIIDEVHNLTSLMRNRLSRYLDPAKPKKGQTTAVQSVLYDPISIEPWRLREGKERKYDRAYLIYRLLSEARNSKIIALSGTPVVNYPEELGILGNLLHGNFHTASFRIPLMDEAKVKSVLENHPYVDFYSVTKGVKMDIFITLLERGFRKIPDPDGNGTSVEYEGPETPSITTVAESVIRELGQKPDKIAPTYKALPLYPVNSSTFQDYFVDKNTVGMKNSLIFMKRMSGLISFYKGGRKDYMPAVNKDVVLKIPMSDHMLGAYLEARRKEREVEDKVKGKPADAPAQATGAATIASESVNWGAITGMPSDSQAKDSAASSYRFRSRALCNFAFPRGIARPFPRDSVEADAAASLDVATYGMEDHDQIIPIEQAPIEEQVDAQEAQNEDARVLQEIDAEEVAQDPTVRSVRGDTEAIIAAQAAEDAGIMGEGLSADAIEELRGLPYELRVLKTVEKLRKRKAEFFSMDPTAPPHKQLAYYSAKYATMYKNIEEAPGSSLVYSQFKTLEGLGIFAIALEANGYARVRLARDGAKVIFNPETAAGIRANPTQRRYMIFSGDPEDAEFRKELVDIFNMNIEEPIYSEVKALLTEVGVYNADRKIGNQAGEFCRIFMITGAGSEGISLKNVRAVHLMEPHWNKVRMDQVKGRAVRICSHKDLAFTQRNVDIYTYLSVLTPEQLRRNQEIVIQDKSMTSDEYIYSVADRKNNLNQQFLETVQMGAVDCELNKLENGMYRCFTRDASEDNFLYDPRLELDTAYTQLFFKKETEIVRRQIIHFKDEEMASLQRAFPREVQRINRIMRGKLGIDYKLIHTEMIDTTNGTNYYGLFSDQELTHPAPFDSSREFAKIEFVLDAQGKPTTIKDIKFTTYEDEPTRIPQRTGVPLASRLVARPAGTGVGVGVGVGLGVSTGPGATANPSPTVPEEQATNPIVETEDNPADLNPTVQGADAIDAEA